MKSGQWHWFDYIYRVNFALVLGAPVGVPKRLARVLPADIAAEASGPDGRMNGEGLAGKGGRACLIRDTPSGDVAVFWFASTSDTAVIAHEALHAVYWILKRKGLTLDEPSEEAYTYYLEWLVREIQNRMRPAR